VSASAASRESERSSAESERASRDRERFLDELDVTATRAADAVGGFVDLCVRLAGQDLRLRFAGPALVARLAPALEHVRTESIGNAALTVKLWDSASTQIPMPSPPWKPDDYREHGKLRGFFGDQLYSVFQWGSNSLSILDAPRDRAFYWVKTAGQVAYFEMAAPLRTILHLWLRERGIQLVHASAVGTGEGCLLLIGPAGAGKSSATLACINSNLGILADDYCLVGPGPRPTVHTVYSAAKLHADALKRMPMLASMVANPQRPPWEKALLFLHQHCPEKLIARAPLRGILLPRVSGEPSSRLVPASPAAALSAIAPSTLLQLPGASQQTLARLADMVRSVPCHHLEAGGDPDGVASTIESLLRR
jgi:hypothetical protein